MVDNDVDIMLQFHLHGPLNEGALEESLRTWAHHLLEGHLVERGHLGQVYRNEGLHDHMVLDLGGWMRDAQELEFKKIASSENQRFLHNSRGIPLKSKLVRYEHDRHILILHLHAPASNLLRLSFCPAEWAKNYHSLLHSELVIDDSAEHGPLAKRLIGENHRRDGASRSTHLAAGAPETTGLRPFRVLPFSRRAEQDWNIRGTSSALLPSAVLLAQKHDIEPLQGLLAALCVLLHRYTGEEEIYLATYFLRPSPGSVPAGLSASLWPRARRIDVSGNPTFNGLVDRMRSDLAWLPDAPEESSDADSSGPARWHTSADILLHGITFSHFSELDLTLDPSGLELSLLDAWIAPRGADLSLTTCQTQNETRLNMVYRQNLYDERFAKDLLMHFEHMLKDIVVRPDARISSELSMYQASEEGKGNSDQTHVSVQPAEDTCLHQAFEQQAQRIPDRVAVTFDGEHVTYGLLDRRSNQVAHALRERGIIPEKVVALSVARSPDTAIYMLGILKAGGVCLMLDPALPKERKELLLETSNARLLISDHAFEGESSTVPCIRLKDRAWPWGDWSARRVPSLTEPSNAALVIFTSGSTGVPKGVISTHLCELSWQWPGAYPFPLEENDVFLQLSYNATTDLFAPWMYGCRVVLPDGEGYRDPSYLIDLIRNEHITVGGFVPSLLQMMLDAGLEKCRSLRLVGAGGESVSYQLRDAFHDIMQADFFNEYALTEAGTLVYRCERDDNRPYLPIGQPIPVSEAYLLDAYLQPVPVGMPGMLFIGGAQLARCYLDDRILTAENFLPNPFSGLSGDRMYRTGDVGCCLPSGDILFLGRRDHQVKVRGYRVELGEVENALRNHRDVDDAAATMHRFGADDERLVGYYVPREQSAINARDLLEDLRAILPDYMIPSIFVRMAELPRTRNGKVDRQKLPPPVEAMERDGNIVPPQNAMQAVLMELWRELLHVDQISIHDDFYLLGGESLLATRLALQLRSILGIEIPLTTVFEHPTITDLDVALKQTAEDAVLIEAIAEAVQELAAMSDDEVEALRREAQEED